jgi:hypothetical protein
MTASPVVSAQSWNGRHLKIAAVTPEERKLIIGQKVAARAYELTELRDFKPGNKDEDWRLAELEVVGPLNCGYLLFDRGLELRADAACFGEGTIEIYAEPRRLTLIGRSRNCEGGAATGMQSGKASPSQTVRSIELPFEIDPSQASAKFQGRMIVAYLPRACHEMAVSAAA